MRWFGNSLDPASTDPVRGNVLKVQDRILQSVRDDFTDAGIDLPFPTNVVLFHDQTEEYDGDRTQQREGWPAREKDTPEARPLNHATLIEGGGKKAVDGPSGD